MKAFTAVAVAALLLVAVSAVPLSQVNADPRARYDGQKVVRAVIDTVEKSMIVSNLDLDVWGQSSESWDIRVNAEQLEILANNNIEYTVYINDLQGLIESTAAPAVTTSTADPFFDNYRRYDEILAFYNARASKYPNLVVKVASVGKTIEGRTIYAYHLRGRASGARKIFWEGGIHAREWISPPTVAYQFDKLVTLYGTDASATFILDNFEVVIIPVVNPDGYEYSHTNDRLWRKNRRVNSGSACRGVDLNRNWDSFWAQGGSSSSPCSDTYHGTAAFSEPESKAISTYFTSLGNVVGAIDFHSYSQLILRPYGHTRTNPPDEANMKALGDGMRDAILPVYGKRYTSQKSIDLYVTTGTASDWFYVGSRNVAWGFTFELRDTGANGFILPPSEIVPQGEEIWAAMKFFGQYIASNHP